MNLRTHETFCTQKCIAPCTSIPQSLHSTRRPVTSASTQRHVSVATLDCHYPNKLQPFELSYNLYKFLSCFLMLPSIRGASVCYFLNSHCIYYKYKPLAEIHYISFKHANKEKFYVCRILSLIGVKKFPNIQALFVL